MVQNCVVLTICYLYGAKWHFLAMCVQDRSEDERTGALALLS